MGTNIQAIHVCPAATADLETLVEIQFAAIGEFETERLVAGENSAENRRRMVQNHAEHLRNNSGLVIAKAVLADKVVGFCMFYFPNTNAANEDERRPTPLRNSAASSEDTATTPTGTFGQFSIQDSERREKVAALKSFIHQEVQHHVAGRECAYIRYMCVDPAYQQQGVGKALMTWACRRFDEQNLDAYLEASPAGKWLYKKYGFEIIGYSKGSFSGGLEIVYSHMWRKNRPLFKS